MGTTTFQSGANQKDLSTASHSQKFHLPRKFLFVLLFLGYLSHPIALAQTVTDPSVLDPNYDLEKENLVSQTQEVETVESFSMMTMESASSLPGSECFIPIDDSYTPVSRNDDGSLGPITLPFEYVLYGTAYTQLWINTNGNLTFNGPLSTFNSQGFPISTPMVAPFWADVDTRFQGGQIYYKITNNSLTVTWNDVSYYGSNDSKVNTFQVIITDGSGSPLAPGHNTAFYYQDLQWTTGTASSGINGFGGVPATVGINKGNGIDYVQMGRFDSDDTTYDGPGDGYDGVNYLDFRCYDTSVISSDNIPPFVSNLPTDNKIILEVGQTVTINPEFIGPEVGQIVTTTVLTEMCGVTSNITNGTSSTANINISGEICNTGTNTISIVAADDGDPQQTTTIEITVEVINPCVISVVTKNIQIPLGREGTVTISGDDINDNSTAGCGIASLELSKTSFNCDDLGLNEVTLTIIDNEGNSSSALAEVTIINDIPVLSAIASPLTPVSVTSVFDLSATYTDNNLKSAKWYFSSNGDFTDPDLAEHTFNGTISNGNIVDTFNSDPANLQLMPGVYSVKLVVTDHCDEIAEVIHDYVVIFDPNGGFLTGRGWIDSPEKAYTSDETLTGRADFGFNAKYKNGKTDTHEVDGRTSFQFKAGNLHFKSSSHEDMSLVISGPKATYKGVGNINGDTEIYNFLVTAIDGELTESTDVDRFRIKIWKDGHVVYDNNVKYGNTADNADPATAIAGGSILIRKPKGGVNNKTQQELTVTETFEPVVEIVETMSVAPNPIQVLAVVNFSLDSDANGILSVFDNTGRKVGDLFSGEIRASEVYEVNFDRGGLPSGYYIIQLELSNGQSFTRNVMLE